MCDSCAWSDKLVELEEMLDDSQFRFAGDTLEGIREWVEEHEHITDKQADAIENIQRSQQ